MILTPFIGIITLAKLLFLAFIPNLAYEGVKPP